MRLMLRSALFLLVAATAAVAQDGEGVPAGVRYSATRSADGFDMPVGKPDAVGYYR